MNLKKIISVLSFAAVFAGHSDMCFAECVPSDDPCAPKKVIGEWVKSLSGGFNLTDGNSNTTLLNLGAVVTLDDNDNLVDFNAAYNYGDDDSVDDPELGNTTRNDFRAGARYDRFLSDKIYTGIGSKVLTDEVADVDYRVSIDPNIGYFLLRDNSFKLRLEGGPSYIFERVGSVEDDYPAPRAAEKFEWAITCTSKFFQQAEAYFDVDDSDNYIVNAEAGVEAALATDLALVFTVRNTYDNQPAEDREENDLQVITSLKVSI